MSTDGTESPEPSPKLGNPGHTPPATPPLPPPSWGHRYPYPPAGGQYRQFPAAPRQPSAPAQPYGWQPYGYQQPWNPPPRPSRLRKFGPVLILGIPSLFGLALFVYGATHTSSTPLTPSAPTIVTDGSLADGALEIGQCYHRMDVNNPDALPPERASYPCPSLEAPYELVTKVLSPSEPICPDGRGFDSTLYGAMKFTSPPTPANPNPPGLYCFQVNLIPGSCYQELVQLHKHLLHVDCGLFDPKQGRVFRVISQTDDNPSAQCGPDTGSQYQYPLPKRRLTCITDPLPPPGR